jgi:hypothetical protein
MYMKIVQYDLIFNIKKYHHHHHCLYHDYQCSLYKYCIGISVSVTSLVATMVWHVEGKALQIHNL